MGDVMRFSGCNAMRSTGKALLVNIPGVGEAWVPQSAIHDDSEVFNATDGASGDLVVAEWWWDARVKEAAAKAREAKAAKKKGGA
jgi:hypothetical protein